MSLTAVVVGVLFIGVVSRRPHSFFAWSSIVLVPLLLTRSAATSVLAVSRFTVTVVRLPNPAMPLATANSC